MGTRDRVLELFEKERGVFLSGEQIAESLSVSRAAVWKSVKGLQAAGYPIEAIRNRGYCLSEKTDILSFQGIRKYLDPICEGLKLQILPCVDSTNTLAREKAAAGAPDGWVIIANGQTGGRGRRGRSFYSPPDTGLYMSLILRPDQYSPGQAVKLTAMAAVAACEAIETLSGQKAMIKWVNDIYLGGRKVCGILTEASFGLEDGFLEYAVLGIGINVSPPEGGFPKEVERIAGPVFEKRQSDGKNRLAAEFLNRFMACYKEPGRLKWAEEYRRRSMVLGRRIGVLLTDGEREATVLDIDSACRLVVRYEDGSTDCLSSGEISIRF